MKPYFGYIRISDRKQKQGVSLEVQKSDIEKFAVQRDYHILEWFIEVQTAGKAGRVVFNGMLARLRQGEASGVIIHKIDRSARNLEDWNAISRLFDSGVDVQFAHEPIDLHSRGGRLSADMLAVVAADFIRNNRQEARKGFYGRLRQGIYPLPAPIGYLDEGKGNPKSLDTERAPFIRRAFERYASNTIGLKELRKEMKQWGLRTSAGKVLSLNSVSQMLHNPFYMGLIHLKKTGETFEGKHPPIVTKSLFDKVQIVLAGKTALRGVRHNFLFRRRVRCEVCWLNLIGERQKGRHVYYRCHSDSCPGTSLREEIIDDLVHKRLKLLLCGEVELKEFRGFVAEEQARASKEMHKSRVSLDLRLAKCNERLSRLTDAYIDQLIDKEIYEAKKRALFEERRHLLDQIASVSATELPRAKAFKKLELGMAAYSGYISGNPFEQRSAVDEVTSNLSVRANNPVITLKSPYQEMVDWRKSQNSAPYRGRPRQRARKLLDIIIAADNETKSTAVNPKKAAWSVGTRTRGIVHLSGIE
jgi:site-specific DNA recombinase